MSITTALSSTNLVSKRSARLSAILSTVSHLLFSLLLVPLVFYSIQAQSNPLPTKTIGISQIVEHPALNDIRTGLMTSLKAQGFEEGKNLTVLYENAQGNMSLSVQIATKLLSASPEVIIGISTPSAQTLLQTAKRGNNRVPIVFTAVSDPQNAQLEPGSTHYPITGLSDLPNLEGLLELMESMMPKMKTLGLMYNPSESNSVSTIKKLKSLLEKKGIQWHEVTVNSTNDVAQATKSLIGKVDALYFPQDNTVVSAMETVIKISQQGSPELPVILPIFCSDPVLMKKGVLAAIGYDYKDMGQETGDIVVKILAGEPANQIPIHHPKNLKAIVNSALAKKWGLPIPTALKHATLTIME